MSLTMRIRYTPKIQAAMKRFAAKLDDRTELLRVLGDRVRVSILKNIMESRSPDGSPFAPLSRPRRKGHNPSMKPLFDTGTMYDSVRWEIAEPNRSVRIGEATPYGKFHQRGTRYMPMRTFVGLRNEDLTGIRDDVSRWLEQILGPFPEAF